MPQSTGRAAPGLTLELVNLGPTTTLSVFDAYTNRTSTHRLGTAQEKVVYWPLEDSFGWYSLSVRDVSEPSFLRRFAGHIETGRDSFSDPALGWQ